MRVPTRISGSALGRMTWRSTCSRLAPSVSAALMRSTGTPRTPDAVESAIAGRMARKISSTFGISPMPNQMTTSGR